MKVEVQNYEGKDYYYVYNDDGKVVDYWNKESVEFIAIDGGMAKFRSKINWEGAYGGSYREGEVIANNSLGEVVRLKETI